jgi:hypothetical protein
MPFWIVDISVGCLLSTSSSEEPLHDAMMATAKMGELAPLLSENITTLIYKQEKDKKQCDSSVC